MKKPSEPSILTTMNPGAGKYRVTDIAKIAAVLMSGMEGLSTKRAAELALELLEECAALPLKSKGIQEAGRVSFNDGLREITGVKRINRAREYFEELLRKHPDMVPEWSPAELGEVSETDGHVSAIYPSTHDDLIDLWLKKWKGAGFLPGEIRSLMAFSLSLRKRSKAHSK